MIHNDLAGRVIGAAIEVHRELGPGLLESAYEACLAHELAARAVPFRRQVDLPVLYKGHRVDAGFRIDLLVENQLVIEFKAVETLLPIHTAQLITYLKLTRIRIGLILNFNCQVMRDGIKRVVCD
ncbi:MAG: GxxExxY protein [Planctomycetota bacterium]